MKLNRSVDYDKGVLTFTAVGGSGKPMIFDFNKLPNEIQKKMGPLGLNHRLGDAAAGLSGTEAEPAINKVWDGLMKGDWHVKAPAKPKVDTAAVKAKLDGMTDKEKAAAASLLEKLGLGNILAGAKS
jgi:hypothetical protein